MLSVVPVVTNVVDVADVFGGNAVVDAVAGAETGIVVVRRNDVAVYQTK